MKMESVSRDELSDVDRTYQTSCDNAHEEADLDQLQLEMPPIGDEEQQSEDLSQQEEYTEREHGSFLMLMADGTEQND